jgi:hypothetical protein
MLIIVGKSIPNPSTGDDEFHLPEFRDTLAKEGCFAYAWDFNPHEKAINALQSNLPAWLYLIHREMPWFSRIRMRIIDFRYDPSPMGLHCPPEWEQYCIKQEWCLSEFSGYKRGKHPPIHLWFLIDQIEDLHPPQDLKQELEQERLHYWFHKSPRPNFRTYTENAFAFLCGDDDC